MQSGVRGAEELGVVASEPFSLSEKRICVAGHRGMVGSTVVRRLQAYRAEVLTTERSDIDLTRQADVEEHLRSLRPDAVVLAAAMVGGIEANRTHPAGFLRDNLAIEANVIHAAYLCGVRKLLFLGSSCIYPRLAPQPITEDSILTGPLEPMRCARLMA